MSFALKLFALLIQNNGLPNLTRLAVANGLGQRFCDEKRRDFGKHSCKRSWMVAKEPASSLLQGKAPVITSCCN